MGSTGEALLGHLGAGGAVPGQWGGPGKGRDGSLGGTGVGDAALGGSVGTGGQEGSAGGTPVPPRGPGRKSRGVMEGERSGHGDRPCRGEPQPWERGECPRNSAP